MVVARRGAPIEQVEQVLSSHSAPLALGATAAHCRSHSNQVPAFSKSLGQMSQAKVSLLVLGDCPHPHARRGEASMTLPGRLVDSADSACTAASRMAPQASARARRGRILASQRAAQRCWFWSMANPRCCLIVWVLLQAGDRAPRRVWTQRTRLTLLAAAAPPPSQGFGTVQSCLKLAAGRLPPHLFVSHNHSDHAGELPVLLAVQAAAGARMALHAEAGVLHTLQEHRLNELRSTGTAPYACRGLPPALALLFLGRAALPQPPSARPTPSVPLPQTSPRVQARA